MVNLQVDLPQREAKKRAHTATHLLHFALDRLLNGTKQAGSLVDNDLLRFDFAAKQPLSHEEMSTLQSQINHRIAHALPVSVEEMGYQDAVQQGAKAFFEDKYGDTVRVVQINDADIELTSVELCGGTHVANTKEIGACLLISQESVASGIRRITALTGPAVARHAHTMEAELIELATRLDCQPKQLTEKLDKVLKELAHLQSDHEALQSQIIASHLDQLFCSNTSVDGFTCAVNLSETDLHFHSFKEVVNQARQRRSDNNWILYTNEGNFALYVGDGSFSAKSFAQEHALKGGGSDQLVQGRDPQIVDIISK